MNCSESSRSAEQRILNLAAMKTEEARLKPIIDRSVQCKRGPLLDRFFYLAGESATETWSGIGGAGDGDTACRSESRRRVVASGMRA